MKTNLITTTLLCLLLPISSAWGSTGTTVYSSGILVLAFMGVCALIVVAQLIPALITLWGIIRGVASEQEAKQAPGHH